MRDDDLVEEGSEEGPDRFGVTVLPVPGRNTYVLTLVGELDRDTVDPLWEAVSTCPAGARIVVDCSGLAFCDSSGLNVLLRVRLRMQEGGGRADLAGLRHPVVRMFEITGAQGVFAVYGSVDEALADRSDGGGHDTGR
ncbi:STAS domain-containing protein [Streptomyces sp. NPDC059491]|uniref:STAS domain-containing protein n=1 Tax=Streptomyces sp. NPDC059491 TaxID=3346850 RepID=UPI0036B3EFA4